MDATKNPNLETTHISQSSLKRTYEEQYLCMKKKVDKCCNDDDDKQEPESCLLGAGELGDHQQSEETAAAGGKMMSGRERLKRHRAEMAGRVWIPDIWGQEDLLKKWIDCTVFDASLERSSIMSAREALVQEGGRSNLILTIVENSC